MTTLRLIFMILALSVLTAASADPGHGIAPANEISAEQAKPYLDYFKKYLADCPEAEIRCLWFLRDSIGIGMIMTIDLREATVYTERDVFNHAHQNSRNREMSHEQTVIAQELLLNLPATAADVAFAEGIHISFWRDKKLQTLTYSKKATPLNVRRLYDVGGGSTEFTYVK